MGLQKSSLYTRSESLAGVGLLPRIWWHERTAGARQCQHGCNSLWPHSSSPTLEKYLKKPFKTRVRTQYQARIVTGPFTYTPSGKKQAPSKELVLQWVKKAWQEIPAEVVIRSFKTCSISNALYLLEIVKVTVIGNICFREIFAYKTHPNFSSNFKVQIWN